MKTDLKNIDKISYWLVVITVLLFLAVLDCSCSGAKKTNKEGAKMDSTATKNEIAIAKEAEAIIETIKVDSTATKSKKEQANSFSEDFIFSPIDPKEESVITDSNGKTTKFKNLRGSTKKEQKSTTSQYDETVKKLSETDKEIASIKENMSALDNEVQLIKKASAKEVQEDQYNWAKFALSFWWLWLIIIVVLIAIYLYYKKINPLSFIKFIK
jgi:hypothetical protein